MNKVLIVVAFHPNSEKVVYAGAIWQKSQGR